ncbi:tRNA glutamyl-Q(34) synthetase GluQRS [Pelagibius litoralis]|uniref:tRNA glutamyl-Q(34) synthetase GluQRS n=1 Tax=Pelagibius litoralis TaxID=374515 RepID=A0A967F1B0_9PROT|nr:tRNA glutamyl-Q(34) synthetase GluQRS [Pelagibius litoralis]NIA71140.1 tRNA glutamyl-Q(34) synthetase GluQRS [Pelagibius litoralis]
MAETTRFAPSPSGYLHLGHAYSALFTARAAAANGGRFLLRIDDIDVERARAEFEAAIFDDLAWLGLSWEQPLRRQSDCAADYALALQRLRERGVTYPCFCTRKEIAAEIARAGAAPHGPNESVYPGTCRGLSAAARDARIAAGEAYALRLDMERALAEAERENGGPLTWHDRGRGRQRCDPRPQGDVVMTRKDVAASYHLAVVVDDAAQDITLVTRGADLFEASHVHRLLQHLLALPVPDYHHHRLLTDENGKRLAKRHDALSIRALREAGHTLEEVIAMTEQPQSS